MSRKSRVGSASISSSTPESNESSSSRAIEFKKYEPIVAPDEGDWYQVQAWRYSEHMPMLLMPREPGWYNEGRGATTLEGVMDPYVEAKEMYAKVRILKTTKTVVTEDDNS